MLSTANLWCVVPPGGPTHVWGGAPAHTKFELTDLLTGRRVAFGVSPGESVLECVLGQDTLSRPVYNVFTGAEDCFYFVHGPERQLSVLGPTTGQSLLNCPARVSAVVPSALGPGALIMYIQNQRFAVSHQGLIGASSRDVLEARVVRAVASGRSFALVLATGNLLFLGPVLQTLPPYSSQEQLTDPGPYHPYPFGAAPSGGPDVGWSQLSP